MSSGSDGEPGDGAGSDARAALAARMALIWDQFRDVQIERMASLDSAARQLAQGALDPDLRSQALNDAHKLAGNLGTFGLHAATADVRAIERRLEEGVPLDATAATSLLDAVERVRRAIREGPR